LFYGPYFKVSSPEEREREREREREMHMKHLESSRNRVLKWAIKKVLSSSFNLLKLNNKVIFHEQYSKRLFFWDFSLHK
jgi:hypothetical protein